MLSTYRLLIAGGNPTYLSELIDMRQRLDRWIVETDDHGREPEPAAMYDSDMKVYLDNINAASKSILQHNIAQMKQWAFEGK